tara:strand:+ start:117 stop:365 length:249 start_codon:yes stop_codon:yes gene_type:complete
MIKCPNCKKEHNLKDWWQKHRLEGLLEYQAKFVANNGGIGVDHTKLSKYKQSERLIRSCGFYDDLKITPEELLYLLKRNDKI